MFWKFYINLIWSILPVKIHTYNLSVIASGQWNGLSCIDCKSLIASASPSENVHIVNFLYKHLYIRTLINLSDIISIIEHVSIYNLVQSNTVESSKQNFLYLMENQSLFSKQNAEESTWSKVADVRVSKLKCRLTLKRFWHTLVPETRTSQEPTKEKRQLE